MSSVRATDRFTHAAFIAILTGLSSVSFATEITVTVSVTAPDGEPIEGAPILVYTDADGGFGFTDDTGAVSYTLDRESDEALITARLWDGTYQDGLSVDERELALERYEALPKMYRFESHYLTQIQPGQTEYQINMTSQLCVEATGRLVDAQGEPITDEFFFVTVRDGAWYDVFQDTNGVFIAHGIPMGRSSELGVSRKGPESHRIQHTADQTSANFDLDDVIVQQHERLVTLDMTVTNSEGVRDLGGALDLGTMVSLIRADAEVLLTFPVKPPEGEVVAEVVQIQTDVPRVTEGEYYVTPGPINSPTAFALLDALRADEHDALDAAGVPRFTALEGQTVEFTLDAAAAQASIQAATSESP